MHLFIKPGFRSYKSWQWVRQGLIRSSKTFLVLCENLVDLFKAWWFIDELSKSSDIITQHLFVEDQVQQLAKDEFRLRQLYRKHNTYVINTVPKENLLVWNLKDGWEPLCKFLNKPIPGLSSRLRGLIQYFLYDALIMRHNRTKIRWTDSTR